MTRLNIALLVHTRAESNIELKILLQWPQYPYNNIIPEVIEEKYTEKEVEPWMGCSKNLTHQKIYLDCLPITVLFTIHSAGKMTDEYTLDILFDNLYIYITMQISFTTMFYTLILRIILEEQTFSFADGWKAAIVIQHNFKSSLNKAVRLFLL